ncbi:GBF-interacting protein 1-like [Humulus lupulus]|uniref:GBF-interacting protein 1-like n=1 Tax=Humulus lupulus TaxID=3486 RepID=UPI002B4114C3|nr:GBF-interacting protein 1-like [Humulus lupulus]
MSSSSGVGGSRVSIPNNVRKTINDIREITGKQHSDDEIYAVLRECSMDPNETAQKLLYLDTFHEVKRRRDRKKDNLNTRASEERSTTGVQRRVRGGGQGNYGSNFSSDVGGGKNGGRRENGANHSTDRGSMSSTVPYSQRMKNNTTSRVTKAVTGMPNGTTNMPNGISSHEPHGFVSKSSTDSEGHSFVDAIKLEPAAAPQPAVSSSPPTVGSLVDEQGKSLSEDDQFSTTSKLPESSVLSSDSPSAPPLGDSGAASIVENDVRSRQLAAEPNEINGNKAVFDDNNLELGHSVSEKAVQGAVNSTLNEKSCEPGEIETVCLSETSQPPLLSIHEVITSEVASTAVEVSPQSKCESNVSDGHHVTFPSDFQVPEALKNGLTFGSFDTKVESVSEGVENMDLTKSSQDTDETYKERSSSVPGDYLENSESLPQVLEKLQPSEGNVSVSTDLKGKQPKQETVAQFPLNGTQIPVVINGPNYGVGLMPPMLGGHLVQLEGHEVQAHENRVPNLANGNSVTSSTANSVTPVPSSIAVTPQPVPVFRQTYPPNFFPYGQYISPYYMPPMHQYLSHNGFPPQPANGNIYLPPPPPPSAAGVKYSLPQYKPGNNAGNPTHIGIQPAGSYITAPVGYAQPVSSGSSMGNEDLAASHMKENQIYTTGQLSEGSAVWIHAAGQEMPSLQMNSMYSSIPHQGHIAYSPQQSGHGAFAGMFPPGHAMTAPSTLLQQSQAVAGATIETAGPPTGAYQQQPQHAQQINWNTSF